MCSSAETLVSRCGRCAVLGIWFEYRFLRGRLCLGTLAAWQLALPSSHRRPSSRDVLKRLALFFAKAGARHPIRGGFFGAAVGPGELLQLTYADVALTVAGAQNPMFAAVAEPKIQHWGARHHSRVIYDGGIFEWLR